MKRLEIIGNKSIEEDLFDLFEKNDIKSYYTKIPSVVGTGRSGPKRGDAVWPEENFLLIIYCENEAAKEIHAVVEEVKTRFPKEGLKLFEL